jgi:hypothetical protein
MPEAKWIAYMLIISLNRASYMLIISYHISNIHLNGLLEQPSLPCLMVQLVAYNTFFKSHHSLRMEDIFYIDLIIGHIRIGLPLCTTLFTC